MKVLGYAFIVLIILLPLSCASEEDGDSLTSVERQLVGTWEVGSVLLNGFDVTNPSYTNFAILFRDDRSYFSVDGDPIFTEFGGFWRLIDNDLNQLEISGQIGSATFDEEGASLTLRFQAEGDQLGEAGRGQGLEGQYEFRLVESDQILD